MAKPITVKILGDASDLQRALGQAETRLSKFGGVAKTAALGAAGAVAGIGAVALKVGGDFDQARKDIAVATGASGAALDDLFDQFKDVAATVPGGMDEVAAATGAVATQLGLTGDDLETVVRSASELAEVLGADLGDTADNAARVMNQFGVAATDADGFMGDLLKATQDFGVDLPGLLSDLEKMGPALQSVGFSAEGATAFLGAANKAGVDVTRLKSPLLQFAKAAIEAGKDPAEAFADFAEQASGVTDSVELLALANENFGTTGGAAIAELVEAGVPLGDLNDLLGDNAGLVGDTVEQTRTWTDKLKILKNRALVAVEPLLSKIVDGIDAFVTALGPAFDTIGDAVEAFKSGGLTGLSDFIEARFGPNSPVTRAMRAFTDAWPDIRDTVTDAIRTVRQVVGTVLDALSLAWETWGDNITAVATTVFEQVDDVIGGVIDVLTG
ncbi:MAG: phage tail tape measure protein, partial [Actinomyces sp.]